MKKKIVVYLSALPTDGGKYQYSQSVVRALENLDQENFSLSAVYIDKHWESILSDKFKMQLLRKNNFLIKTVKKVLFLISPNMGRDIWRVVGEFVDLNHKTFFDINPYLIIYPGKDPFVHEIKLTGIVPVFDLMHRYENFPELNQGGIYKERELYYKRLSKYSAGILVDSEVGKSHVIECYSADPNKIFVLPFIAPPYIFENLDSVKIEKIKIKYRLPANFIFYPAQFWLHKNHLGLLEALFLLKQQGLLVNCVLVGAKKNVYDKIAKKIEEYDLGDQVFILNFVANEEVVALYKTAIALVMPTFFGPTNIPQLEAFELGCPVLTSNIYGIPEQVGDAALLFNPKAPSDIALKIKQIITNPELSKQLIEKGKIRSAEFTQERFNEKFSSLIHEIMTNIPPHN